MDRRSNGDWFPAALTAGSFLATLSVSIVGFFDALEGSQWSALEFGLALLCGAAFASLLTGHHPARILSESVDDIDS